jgi:hypothetical protein
MDLQRDVACQNAIMISCREMRIRTTIQNWNYFLTRTSQGPNILRTSFVATAVPGFPVIQLRPGAPFQITLKQLFIAAESREQLRQSVLHTQNSIIGRFCSRPALAWSLSFNRFLQQLYHLLMCVVGFSAFVTSQVSFSDGRSCKLCVCVW